MSDKPLPLNSNMLLYANLLPVIRQIARDHGYAVGVHGSMVTDLDLMLMPWVENVQPVHTCIVAIAKACGGFFPMGGSHKVGEKWVLSDNPGVKPHNRFSWTIAFGGAAYLDISVVVPKEVPNLSGGTTTEQRQNDADGEVTITAKAGRCAACKDTILDMGVRTGGEWYHNACASKPAAASAWEEFWRAQGVDDAKDREAMHYGDFNRFVAAREKAAILGAPPWERCGNCQAATLSHFCYCPKCGTGQTRPVDAPKPDAGRAEGVKFENITCTVTGRPDGSIWVEPAPKPRRAPEVVAESILAEYKKITGGCAFAHFQLKDIIAAAVRADRAGPANLTIPAPDGGQAAR